MFQLCASVLEKGHQFSPHLLKPCLIMNLWSESGYCAVQHESLWSSFSVTSKERPVWLIQRWVSLNGSWKFFRESSKLHAVGRQEGCSNSTKANYQRENADKYQRVWPSLCNKVKVPSCPLIAALTTRNQLPQ